MSFMPDVVRKEKMLYRLGGAQLKGMCNRMDMKTNIIRIIFKIENWIIGCEDWARISRLGKKKRWRVCKGFRASG